MAEKNTNIQCVRCLSETAYLAASAPDGSGAWDLYCCSYCNYGWRTTEGSEITDVTKRDPRFSVDKNEVESVFCLNPIPKLLNKE
ncbi:MAG: hypothetical protein CVU86_01745 [Firmicutes bacterium HGW-Firmicutes-11]|jgi:hypothetical protein|nr:MAG: hypothetical protein CVU86_01745 [Firmicutes bacterium HGW-Firmicutes-11]